MSAPRSSSFLLAHVERDRKGTKGALEKRPVGQWDGYGFGDRNWARITTCRDSPGEGKQVNDLITQYLGQRLKGNKMLLPVSPARSTTKPNEAGRVWNGTCSVQGRQQPAGGNNGPSGGKI